MEESQKFLVRMTYSVGINSHNQVSGKKLRTGATFSVLSFLVAFGLAPPAA